jgi:hypothetical protein
MSAVSSRKLARFVSHAVLDMLCFAAPWDRHMHAFIHGSLPQTAAGAGSLVHRANASAVQGSGLHGTAAVDESQR